MTTTMTSSSVSNVASTLLALAAVALEGSSSGAVTRVEMVAGAEVPWDDCDCGMLAVHMPEMFDGRGLFSSAADQGQNCICPVISVRLFFTVLRCAAMPTDNGVPPTADEMTADFVVQAEDAFLVREAVACGLQSLRNVNQVGGPQIIDGMINRQAPVGQLGGCVGTALEVVIAFSRSCNCGAE